MNSENAYYAEWAEALLCAGAAGDSQAADMYRIAHWLSLGGECTDTDMLAITEYIEWVESKQE
jgi:hypothetical protein